MCLSIATVSSINTNSPASVDYEVISFQGLGLSLLDYNKNSADSNARGDMDCQLLNSNEK
jgi:hypothetical protein